MARRVQAAGGIVCRTGEGGRPEIAVIHRPKHFDWSFPKGKLERGESHQQAAVREVEEETGLRCRLGRELPSVSYVDPKGRPKTVRYWEMSVVAGEFRPNREVDELRWLGLEEASECLTHRRDRDLLEGLSGD